ncbi:hypothetical protein [Candidatus Villigracilis saccharophilus]|uniref:hypothetical protein n=1 Tax=Candidatus Villigracilis saccharophilus TaxID=3140684 RepID=UPI0031E79766
MTEKMPVLFVGHGSPMNAIEDNEFTRAWAEAGKGPAKTARNSVHFSTLGHTRHTGNCHGTAAHDL